MREAARRHPRLLAQRLAQRQPTTTLSAVLTCLGEPQLALALCHRVGRVRQKALRPSARPAAVARDPLRRLGRPGARSRPPTTARGPGRGQRPRVAPVILRVGRRDQGAFAVDLLAQVLRRPPHGQLAALHTVPDRVVRRFAYRQAVGDRLLTFAAPARAASRDEDTVVQDLCATAALAALDEEEAYEDVLPPLLSARNPRARSAGVTGLRRAGRPKRAEPFLGDPSALVCACARYVVRQQGGDPAAWYRERCAAPDTPSNCRPGRPSAATARTPAGINASPVKTARAASGRSLPGCDRLIRMGPVGRWRRGVDADGGPGQVARARRGRPGEGGGSGAGDAFGRTAFPRPGLHGRDGSELEVAQGVDHGGDGRLVGAFAVVGCHEVNVPLGHVAHVEFDQAAGGEVAYDRGAREDGDGLP